MMVTRKLVFIFFFYVTFYSDAQILYSDNKGVIVFYKIEQTGKFTFCQFDEESDKKINIWKVTLGIENESSGTIEPRGVGIANIHVNPDPLKPYSGDYCNYKRIKNYESNHGHTDQSLFAWPIRDYAIQEIKSGERITNTSYLYLYEGQTPKLTIWQFSGYRLKEDFKSNINTPIVKNNTKTLQKLGNKGINIRLESEKIKYVYKIDSLKTPTVKNDEIKYYDIGVKASKPKRDKKTVDVAEDSSNTSSLECPGKKALEYKEKSNTSKTPSEQRAYSWLAIYYSYKCECENGSPRSEGLVAIINNLVDSYTTNTNDAYGKIYKVSKCKPSITSEKK